MSDAKRKLLDHLKTYSVLRGEFILASGQKSDTYVDVRATALRSDGLVTIGRALYDEIKNESPNVSYIGGLALGAVPIITAVAFQAGLEGDEDFHAIIVRKDTKDHGTQNLIEPSTTPPEGTRLVAIDDVITTAGSTIKAIKVLRDAGYRIEDAYAIIDRQSGGAEALEEIGVKLHALFHLDDVILPV